jgi:hypothetical protein
MHHGSNAWFLSGVIGILGRSKQVLAIPGLDLVYGPDRPSRRIGASKALLVKQILPEAWPLTIHMTLARLIRASCGEQDFIRVSGQVFHDRWGMLQFQVFGHLQTKRHIKPPRQAKRFPEIVQMKVLSGEEEILFGN